MKYFYALFVSLSITFVAFSQTEPKNIVVVLAHGMGQNHALEAGSALLDYPVKYAVTNHPAYSNVITEPKSVQYFTGDYHTRRVWSEFDYTNNMITCPASAGTAIATGIKSAYKAVGVDLDSTHLETILERAFALGKSTGVITDMPLSKSGVASFAAHNVSSDNTTEIFAQLLGSDLSLMMGVGNPYYSNSGEAFVDPNFQYILESDWAALLENEIEFSHGITASDITGDGQPNSWSFIQTLDDMDSPLPRVLFVPQMHDALHYKSPSEVSAVPTLTNLVAKGLQHLSANNHGFAAVVETGAVDYASRNNSVEGVSAAMLELTSLVAEINNWVDVNSSWDETLVIVVGTYETGFLTASGFDREANTFVESIPAQGDISTMEFQDVVPTKLPTPLFARGAGSEFFADYADQEDFVYGDVITNAEIGQLCKRVWPLEPLAVPKNIILMINDGAALNSIRAAEYYKGERQAYRDFPVSMYMSTYQLSTHDNVSQLRNWNNSYESRLAWTDSAYLLNRNNATCSGASATAIATGQKTYYYSMGVDKDGNALNTIARHAKDIQKSAGFAITKAIYDATPAAFFTNNVNRENLSEITRQLIIESKADVAIGTNHPGYRDDGSARENLSVTNIGGKEVWEDIIAGKTVFRTPSNSGWTEVRDVTGDGIPNPWTLIEDSVQFADLLTGDTPDRILGIAKVGFSTQLRRNNISVQEVSFDDLNPEMPSLDMMAGVALNHLSKNPNGFFLMIEGAALDNAGHSNWKGRLIEEQIFFDRTVDYVIDWIENNGGWEENLLIVTSDHETGLLLGPDFTSDYTLLNHYDIIDNGPGNMPGMTFYSTHHSNQLVPFFAKGAGSEVFLEYADEQDYVFGKYISNSELGQGMFRLWDGRPGTIINHKPFLISSNPIDDIEVTVGTTKNFSIEPGFIGDKEDTEFLYSVSARPSWLEVIDEQSMTYTAAPTRHTGRFTVIIQAYDGAQSGAGLKVEASFAIIVNDAETSLSSIGEQDVHAYPNPASLQLIVPVETGSAQVVLYNQLGVSVVQKFVSDVQAHINVADLPPGVYMLHVHEQNKTRKQTIIIQ